MLNIIKAIYKWCNCFRILVYGVCKNSASVMSLHARNTFDCTTQH
jgi:hypothetical protein